MSEGRDLNPRPADFSTDIMLLDSRALFLTTPYGFAWYSASFVQKMFTPKFCAEVRSSRVVTFLVLTNENAARIDNGDRPVAAAAVRRVREPRPAKAVVERDAERQADRG